MANDGILTVVNQVDSRYPGLYRSSSTISTFPAHNIPTQKTPATDYTGATLDQAHLRNWRTTSGAFSTKIYRQLLGLNPFKSSFLSLYRSLHNPCDRAVAVLGLICAVGAGIPLPIISLLFGKIINAFPPSEMEVTQRITELLGVAVAYLVVTSIYAISFGMTSERIAMQLRQDTLDSVLHLDQAYLDTHDLDMTALLTEKIDVIHNGCSEKVGIFVQSVSYFVAAFIVGFILSPKLTGILLAAVVPAMIIIVFCTSTSISKFTKKSSIHAEKANGIVESALKAVKTLQAFDMMVKVCERYASALHQSNHFNVRRAVASAVQMGAIFFTAYAVNGLAFYVGSQMAASGQAGGEAGTIFAVVLLILDSSFVVAQFAPFIEIFARAATAREQLQDLFNASNRTKELQNDGLIPPSDAVRTGDIVFRDVIFSYPARPTVRALDGLDMVIQPGSFTAVVGASGGGKSTLVALLTGTYKYSGSICIGTHEVRNLSLAGLRSQIAVVEQESALFTGTIFDNICNGLAEYDLGEETTQIRCRQACEDAGVDFLDALPKGIYSEVGNGLQLSGGQVQRLCLARALIAEPAILIADEPTSALDAHSELLVTQALRNATKNGTTVIMIAHRLSTVLNADDIVVMADGRVIEQGLPERLAKEGIVFRSLLQAQNLRHDSSASPASTLVNSQCESQEGLEKVKLSAAPESQHDEVVRNIRQAPNLGWRNALAHVWPLLRPDFIIILLGILASTVSGGLLIGEAIIFGNLVQLLSQDVDSPGFQERANLFCLLFFILACVALLSWVISGSLFGVSSGRVVTKIKMTLLSRLLYLDLEWFSLEGHSIHSLLGAFTKDTGDLAGLSGPALGTIFTTTTSLTGGIVLAHIVAWKIAVVILSAVPVMLCAGFLRIRVLGIADSRRRTAYAEATRLAVEACRARRTVAVLQYENKCLDMYKAALAKPHKKGRWFIAWSNVLLAFSFAITYFVYSLAYWWGSRLVRKGEYSPKQFFTVLPALLFSSQSAGQLFSLSPEIARAKAACQSLTRLFDASPAILSSHETSDSSSISLVEKASSGKSLAVNAPHLEFCNVSLSYAGAKNIRALDNASFQVARGQTVALVGRSGAGKSTTVSLIERFYNITSGSIQIDGTNINYIGVVELRSRIGLVSQEPDLLPGSIAYNVKLGAKPGQLIDDSDVQEVCKMCGVHDFITSLPESYETECGSNGTSTLSGGQRQRIALARALVRDPEILLLDEPTSALDAHSERQIQEALNQASKDRTTIIVAHRLTSIMHADCICVFDAGSVVEKGTHEELINQNGLYASMARAQSLA